MPRIKRATRQPNLVDVLTGLSPRLVRDLAGLEGADASTLAVIFGKMPWGDRATLSAYGVLTLKRDIDRVGRISSVADWAPDLVRTAAAVLLHDDIINELRPLRQELIALATTGIQAAETVQVAELVPVLPTEAPVRSAASVVAVAADDADRVATHVLLEVRARGRGSHQTHQIHKIEIDIANAPALAAGDRVLLGWREESQDIRRPDFAAPELTDHSMTAATAAGRGNRSISPPTEATSRTDFAHAISEIWANQYTEVIGTSRQPQSPTKEEVTEMAGNQNRRDVSGNRRDGYKVTGGGKTTARASTQGKAEAEAKRQVDRAGGGQVVIHRPDGRIRDADTVAPGNESPKKDTKH